jgi:hypothetical protein
MPDYKNQRLRSFLIRPLLQSREPQIGLKTLSDSNLVYLGGCSGVYVH